MLPSLRALRVHLRHRFGGVSVQEHEEALGSVWIRAATRPGSFRRAYADGGERALVAALKVAAYRTCNDRHRHAGVCRRHAEAARAGVMDRSDGWHGLRRAETVRLADEVVGLVAGAVAAHGGARYGAPLAEVFSGEPANIQAIAKRHGVVRETLQRKTGAVRASLAAALAA